MGGEDAQSKNVVFPARRQSPVTRLRRKVLLRKNHSQAKSVPAVTRGFFKSIHLSFPYAQAFSKSTYLGPNRFPFFQNGIAKSKSRIKGLTGELLLAQELLLVSSEEFQDNKAITTDRGVFLFLTSFPKPRYPAYPQKSSIPCKSSQARVWFPRSKFHFPSLLLSPSGPRSRRRREVRQRALPNSRSSLFQ